LLPEGPGYGYPSLHADEIGSHRGNVRIWEIEKMLERPRRRFWVETILACLSGGLVALTLVWHNWIELLFGVEPDGGDGSFEWTLVVGLLVLTAVFSALARIEWRRARTQSKSI
jgi:hypothetical protein